MLEGIKAIGRKMIDKGNSNDEIMELSNLTLEDIQLLRRENE